MGGFCLLYGIYTENSRLKWPISAYPGYAGFGPISPPFGEGTTIQRSIKNGSRSPRGPLMASHFATAFFCAASALTLPSFWWQQYPIIGDGSFLMPARFSSFSIRRLSAIDGPHHLLARLTPVLTSNTVTPGGGPSKPKRSRCNSLASSLGP